MLAVFSQDKLDKQLVGGRVEKGTFRAKASFEIMRAAAVPAGTGAAAGSAVSGAVGSAGANSNAAAGNGAKTSAGTGRTLGLREKKSELTTAEKGKEIGVLASSQVAIKVGDTLVIHK